MVKADPNGVEIDTGAGIGNFDGGGGGKADKVVIAWFDEFDFGREEIGAGRSGGGRRGGGGADGTEDLVGTNGSGRSRDVDIDGWGWGEGIRAGRMVESEWEWR